MQPVRGVMRWSDVEKREEEEGGGGIVITRPWERKLSTTNCYFCSAEQRPIDNVGPPSFFAPLFRKLFVCPLRVKREKGKTTISARGVSLFLYLPTKKFDTQSAATEEEEGKKFFPGCYVLYYSLTRSFIRWTSAAGIRRVFILLG